MNKETKVVRSSNKHSNQAGAFYLAGIPSAAVLVIGSDEEDSNSAEKITSEESTSELMTPEFYESLSTEEKDIRKDMTQILYNLSKMVNDIKDCRETLKNKTF